VESFIDCKLQYRGLGDLSFLIYDFFLNKLGNGGVDFSGYKGNALLIVNVASRCGFTTQYKHLQKLHEKLSGKNFSVLAFPCNDFFNKSQPLEG
jgi:glutathione peroxidase-family protein